MNQPCSNCERNSRALAMVGGHLEAMKASWRPKTVLGLEADDLIAAVGGREQKKLEAELCNFEAGASAGEAGAEGVVASCRHSGAFEYPEVLASDPEPPWVIWLSGNPALLARASIGGAAGIVGARRADAYGNAVARDLGRSVARAGGTVISGLAFGIDAAAHRGALDIDGGHTIAVTGGGVDVVYPKAHGSLHEQIVQKGLVLSEMPPGSALWKWSFPARNRLIAALSQIVVVVQGAKRSGSLHTADAALARGRTLAAVPGRIDSAVSEGSNQLIADGAAVITSGSVLTRMLGLSAGGATTKLGPDLMAVARAVSEGTLDSHMAEVGTARVSAALARLELMGLAEPGVDGRWRLVG